MYNFLVQPQHCNMLFTYTQSSAGKTMSLWHQYCSWDRSGRIRYTTLIRVIFVVVYTHTWALQYAVLIKELDCSMSLVNDICSEKATFNSRLDSQSWQLEHYRCTCMNYATGNELNIHMVLEYLGICKFNASYVLLCCQWSADELFSSPSVQPSATPASVCQYPSCTTRRNSLHRQWQSPCTWRVHGLGSPRLLPQGCEMILQTHQPMATDFIGNL